MVDGPDGAGFIPPAAGLTVDVEQRGEAIVARIDGNLTVQTAPTIRGRLFTCLAGAPSALIVEVGGLRADADPPLTVFLLVQRQARRWPGIPMLLCGVDQALAGGLSRLGPDGGLPIYPSVEHALAVLDRLDPARATIRRDLPAIADSCARARSMIFRVCQDWGLARMSDAAGVIVSELVSNAVLHARPPIELLIVVRGDDLHVAVRDRSPVLPQPPQSSMSLPPSMTHGRGLGLIGTFASSWGAMPTTDGKVVWATVRRMS